MKKIMRLALYLSGLLMLALGSVLSIRSGLGVTASASLGFVLSERTGLSMGTLTVANFALYIVAQLFLARRESYLRILLQLPFSVFFSWMIDVFLAWIRLEPAGAAGRVLCMIAGVLLTSLGVFASVSPHIVPAAPDGIVQTISERFAWKFGNVKNVFDLTIVFLSAGLGWLLLGRVVGIGVGTVVSALVTGRLVRLLENCFGSRVARLRAAVQEEA